MQKIEYKSVRNRWGNSEKKGAVFLQRRKPFQQNVSSSKSKQHRKLHNLIQPNKICAPYTVKPSYWCWWRSSKRQSRDMIMNRIFTVSMYLRVEMIMSWWSDDKDKIIQDIAVLMCEKKVMLGWVAIASPCRCKASPEISFCAAATPQHHRHVWHDRRALLFFLWDKFSYTGPLENVNVSIKTWHSIKRRKHHTRY